MPAKDFLPPENPGEEGMLLFIDHGIFMEFMPVSEYGKKHPQTIGLQDVETHKNYALDHYHQWWFMAIYAW